MIPFPIPAFAGIDLASDPTDLGTGTADDLLNVDLDRPGMLRSRDGYAKLGSALSSTGVAAYTSGSLRHLVVTGGSGTGGSVKAYDTAGTLVTSSAVHLGGSFSAAAIGDATHEYLFVATANLTQKWDGSAFSNANVPQCSFLAVKGDTNRLVAANIAASGIIGTGKSRIAFSNPDAPESWTYSAGPPETGSWVDLTPGDGSQINGLAAWNNLVFAFKDQRFFVFGVEGELSDGTTEFDYHTIDGYGAVTYGAEAGDEGVYFFDGRSVWLTTGGTPVRVSAPIERFLRQQSTIAGLTYTGLGATHLAYSQGRLYLTVATSGAQFNLTLVYDARGAFWTAMLWTRNATSDQTGLVDACVLTDTSGVPHTYAVLGTGGSNILARIADPTLTTDDGTAITWSYQTGYSNAGGYFRQRIVSSGERKHFHHIDILGAGNVTHQVLALNARPNDVADPGGSVTLGSYPALARGYRRRGVRGTYFAHKFSGSGPAIIAEATYWLQGVESDT